MDEPEELHCHCCTKLKNDMVDYHKGTLPAQTLYLQTNGYTDAVVSSTMTNQHRV